MKEISVAQLKKYLSSIDKKEADEIILKFFKESPFVKRGMSYKVLGEEYGEYLLDEYSWKMDREFNKNAYTSLRTVDSFGASLRRETFDNPKLYGEFLLEYAQFVKKDVLGYEYANTTYVNTLVRIFKNLVKIVSKNQMLFNRWKGQMLEILDQKGMKYYEGRQAMEEEYQKIPWLHNEGAKIDEPIG